MGGENPNQNKSSLAQNQIYLLFFVLQTDPKDDWPGIKFLLETGTLLLDIQLLHNLADACIINCIISWATTARFHVELWSVLASHWSIHLLYVTPTPLKIKQQQNQVKIHKGTSSHRNTKAQVCCTMKNSSQTFHKQYYNYFTFGFTRLDKLASSYLYPALSYLMYKKHVKIVIFL